MNHKKLKEKPKETLQSKAEKIKSKNGSSSTDKAIVAQKSKTLTDYEPSDLSLIEKLPVEILLEIANHLCFKELAKLSLTCSVWYNVVNFIKQRRGPQTLTLKLHLKYERRSCQRCYSEIWVHSNEYEIHNVFEVIGDVKFRFCDDLCPGLELLNDSLYCQPRCIIIFGTDRVIAESRIVHEKVQKKMNISDSIWYVIGTKGLRHGNTEVKHLSEQLIGLFLPGGRREDDPNLDSTSAQEKFNAYNYFINWISPSINDIYRAIGVKPRLPYLHLPFTDVKGYVDQLLNDVNYVNISSPSLEECTDDPLRLEEKNMFPERNRRRDSVIILVFFPCMTCIKQYLNILFKDIFHRYLDKLKRVSVFGIEVNKKVQLDKSYHVNLPDLFIYNCTFQAVSLSSINTERTYWTVGSINLFDDDYTQKNILKKDKERLGFSEWYLLSMGNEKKKRFAVIALCSIGADEWNDKTRVLHDNLSQVFTDIEFEYLLRGCKNGYISFDEKNLSFDGITDFNTFSNREYEKFHNSFEYSTDEANTFVANYIVIITRNP